MIILNITSDTGYRSLPESATPDQEYDTKYLDTLPFCPAFKGQTHEKKGDIIMNAYSHDLFNRNW